MDVVTDAQLKQFDDNGYLVLEDFATDAEMESMKSACKQMIDEMDPAEHNAVFSTTNHSFRDDYFIDSADRISFFFEENARDKDGNLMYDKHDSLNKIGHALHKFSPAFINFTFSDKVQNVAKRMGFVEPVVCESMYILKSPRIGSKVVAHQDGTFMYVEPLKLVGLWIALEDATVDNGCLWFIQGSHKNGIHNGRRLIRNPDPNATPITTFTAAKAEYDEGEFVPVPIKKGSMIAIHGAVVHKSEDNDSDKSRHIYTFHFYEQHGAKWSEQNWLQPTEAGVFSHLYREEEKPKSMNI